MATKTAEKKDLVMSDRVLGETGMIKSNACLSAGVYLVCVIVDRRNDSEYSPLSDCLKSACRLLNEKKKRTEGLIDARK